MKIDIQFTDDIYDVSMPLHTSEETTEVDIIHGRGSVLTDYSVTKCVICTRFLCGKYQDGNCAVWGRRLSSLWGL